jgi:hypothetical protein
VASFLCQYLQLQLYSRFPNQTSVCIFYFASKKMSAHYRTLSIPCERLWVPPYAISPFPVTILWGGGVKIPPLLLCFILLNLVAVHILPSKQERIFHNSSKQVVNLLLYFNFCVLEYRCQDKL